MPRPTGTPTWIDVGSNNAESSRALYRDLFGWVFEDQGEQFGHYELVSQGGDVIAGFMDVAGMSMPDGTPIPDRWDVFLAVEDMAARLDLAVAHGATVLSSSVTMPGLGAFAIIEDPTGAIVGLWESRGFEGYTFSGSPGTPVWFELMTSNFDVSVAVYRDVFEFEIVAMPAESESAGVRYVTTGEGMTAWAGSGEASAFLPAGTPSHWRLYFEIEATEPTLARVRELGGQVLDGPMDSPFGRCTTVADPAGSVFQLNAGSEAAR
ncbi:MAG: VOC family protein [Ancrocorticia sp.]|nr:VOC family protein [Ancrocorticia sp.]